MGMRSKSAVALAAAAVALGVAGCGGSSEPSKADFIAQANKLCARTKTVLTEYVETRSGAARASPDAMVQFVLGIVGREEALVRRLAALDPPSAIKAEYEAYLATRRSENDLQREVVRLAAPSATGTIAEGTKAAAVRDKRTVLAHKAVDQGRALGFRYCGG